LKVAILEQTLIRHRKEGSGMKGITAMAGILERVAGKEFGWNTGPIAGMPDGIEEELKRKGIHVQYRDVSLYRRRKPLYNPVGCDEGEARKECPES
jgi:hypothetical protein